MSTKEVLIHARSIIAKPENWTKGAFARMADGEPAGEFDTRACKFCALGAVYKAAAELDGNSGLDEALALNRALRNKRLNPSVSVFNDRDSTTHEDVLKLFDETIEGLS